MLLSWKCRSQLLIMRTCGDRWFIRGHIITCPLDRTLSSNRLHNPCKTRLLLQTMKKAQVHIAVVKVSASAAIRDLPSVNALSCIVSLALTESRLSRDSRDFSRTHRRRTWSILVRQDPVFSSRKIEQICGGIIGISRVSTIETFAKSLSRLPWKIMTKRLWVILLIVGCAVALSSDSSRE